MSICVVTVSLPERDEFRAECIRSITSQTRAPIAHVVMIDHDRVGPAEMLNRALPACVATGAEWIAQLADDDLAMPHHLETLISASTDADIVYSYANVEGRANFNPNSPFDANALRFVNYIPATTLIRTSLCVELGWRSDAAHGWEDWDFWLRALDRDARFVCVPEITWTYRFHGANLSTSAG